jgi:formate hydrogenlyase transcriptional activator
VLRAAVRNDCLPKRETLWNFELRNEQENSHGRTEQLQGTQSALQDEKERLSLLLELTNNLVSNRNIRETLKTVIGSVRHVTRSDFVGVGLPDSENERFQVYMFNFIANGDFCDCELVLGNDSLPVRVFRTGTPWSGNVENLSESRLREDFLFAPELKTLCVLPLLSRDRALGILVIGRRADNPYAPDEISFLGQVCNLIGIAVENVLSYRQIADLTEKLSRDSARGCAPDCSHQSGFGSYGWRAEVPLRSLLPLECFSCRDSPVT